MPARRPRRATPTLAPLEPRRLLSTLEIPPSGIDTTPPSSPVPVAISPYADASVSAVGDPIHSPPYLSLQSIYRGLLGTDAPAGSGLDWPAPYAATRSPEPSPTVFYD